MSTPLISHPFRLTPSGQIATRSDGSDDYVQERLAMLILTKPGERPMQPMLGLADPTFEGVQHGSLIAQVDQFMPGVSITKVEQTPTGDTTSDVYVEFDTNLNT